MFDLTENLSPQVFSETAPVGYYGMSFLDDYLKSINMGELVLIGSASGCGKSSLGQQIAIYNSGKNVKTALFSLENSKGDTLRKEIYKIYREKKSDWKLSFREFNVLISQGKYDIDCYCEAEKKAKEILQNIWLYEKPTSGFTVETLVNEMDKAVVWAGCKLVIIDHLDYFDQLASTQDENKYLREIMKKIRELMEVYSVPVVCFSQFRKPTDQKMVIPSMYEFYGSSDKAKIATTVITMARNYEGTKKEKDDGNNFYIHTYIAIRKDRFGCTKMADCIYDLKHGIYINTYRAGNTDEWGHSISYD